MRWWLGLIAGPALALAACGGSDDDSEPASVTGAPAAERAADESQSQAAEEPESDAAAAESEAVGGLRRGRLRAGRCRGEDPFDPDAADLTQLIFWTIEDSLVTLRLNLPPDKQRLIDQLLGSDSPAVDKYVVDLAGFPNPYRLQVIDYLRARYETPPYNTVFDFPALFQFDPSDTDTDAYVRFKQALFAGQFADMAALMDPDFPRTIDARQVMWGGVRVDGIPPLEFPVQVTAEDAARWINDSDEVIGVEVSGDVRAYPIRIIAWHEMVNDTIGGIPVSLAYCTLCGAAILYDGRVGGEVYRFGTSGLLYRSNKLMYDRTTRTLWNQFTGEPAWGPLVGEGIRLDVVPVVLTTWGDWHERHPESTVLSIETGFDRDYGPGVAYAEYNSSPETWFNVPAQDDRLPPKEEVYVVRLDATLAVYPTERLAALGFVQETVGGTALVVVATGDGAGGRAYASAGWSSLGPIRRQGR